MSPIALTYGKGCLIACEAQAVGKSVNDFDPGEVLGKSEKGA
jgi:hypothetical protein